VLPNNIPATTPNRILSDLFPISIITNPLKTSAAPTLARSKTRSINREARDNLLYRNPRKKPNKVNIATSNKL